MPIVNITFPVDLTALRRVRRLRLIVGGNMSRYDIPLDPMYDPVRIFQQTFQSPGYRFRLVTLLHVTALKMLLMPKATRRRQSLFATGGLYLALDDQNLDLRIRQSFGDFTSSFSHQIGVGLACIAMSEMFNVEWDQLTLIPVGHNKVLDYQAPISGTMLQIEAKGTTSAKGRENLAREAYKKKLTNSKDLNSPVKTFIPPIAMLAVIVEATLAGTGQGIIQVIDPEPKLSSISIDDSMATGRYRHYAGVARLAGLNLAAEELDRRAVQRVRRQRVTSRLKSIVIPSEATYVRGSQTFGGVQWRLGEEAASETWFYQAADIGRLNGILGNDIFPHVSLAIQT